MKKQLFIGLALSVAGLQANAWGTIGHKATALVAEAYLSPEAKAAIKDLLEGERLVDVANWADNVRERPEYAHTAGYHFQNTKRMPAGSRDSNSYRANLMQLTSRERANYRAGVVEAIAESEKVLADVSATRKDKQAALKFMVHFVGDLHQPLHTGEARLVGGNPIKLNWMGNQTNLHKVWDSEIIGEKVSEIRGYTNYRDPSWTYAQWLLDTYRSDAKAPRAASNVAGWYQESLNAQAQAYDRSYINNQRAYEAQASKTIDQRIMLGGRRLGEMLNQLFKKQPAIRASTFTAVSVGGVPDQQVISFAEKIVGSLGRLVSFKPRSYSY